MGFCSCPICTEELKEDIVTTKCGHIFHSVCVLQWLKNNRACPTCRTIARKNELIKLFLDSPDESFRASQVPQCDFNEEAFLKCTRLNNELANRIKDLSNTIEGLKSEGVEKEETFQKVAKAKASLERDFKNTKQTCFNLRTKMKYMIEDADKAKELTERTVRLEREVKAMRGLKTILEGSQEECDEIVSQLLRGTADIETMGRYVAGLKRDYSSLQKSKTEVQAQGEELQRKVSLSRITIQNLRGEIAELKRDKQQAEQDLSVAERRNDSLCKKIGVYEDKSMNNTNLLNVSKGTVRRSIDQQGTVRRSIDQQTPIQFNKRHKTEQSTPMLFDDSFSEITRGFVAELSRNDELDALAAELGVDVGMAETPGRAKQHPTEDNLFTKVGFDGLGGTARIKKHLPPPRSVFSKQANKPSRDMASSSSLARKTTLGNFFRKL